MISLLGALALGAAVAAGCGGNSSSDGPSGGGASGATNAAAAPSAAGKAGSASGGAPGLAGAPAESGAAGGSDAGGEGDAGGHGGVSGDGGAPDGCGAYVSEEPLGAAGAGGAFSCDCTQDQQDAHVPLECACALGMCTTLQGDLPRYACGLGRPFYLLLGTCEGGYRTLRFAASLEAAGERTYDPAGRLVYSSYGPYAVVPAACGFEDPFLGGSLILGENPAVDCEYCLVAKGPHPGGSGYATYPESDTAPCDPERLK